MWRAIRFGLDGELIDLDAATRASAAAQAWERLLTWTAPVRAELGSTPSVPSAQRRAAPARARSPPVRAMQEVYAQTVRETRETYAREGSAA